MSAPWGFAEFLTPAGEIGLNPSSGPEFLTPADEIGLNPSSGPEFLTPAGDIGLSRPLAARIPHTRQ